MGRNQRNDADYFPFFVKDGKTLFILQQRYGLEGIGFFTNIMRMLTRTPFHYAQIRGEADELYFWTTIGTTKEQGEKILETMMITGKIDRELYEKYQVIVSPDLIDSLKPLYDKRTNPIMCMNDIKAKFVPDFRPEKTDNRGSYTQRKVEKSKVDLSLRTEIFEIFYFKNFIRPHEEADKFINHYEKTGFKDKNGNPISNLLAAARQWEQKETLPNMPAKLLERWKGVYDSMKEAFPNDAPKLLKLKPRKLENGNLMFQAASPEHIEAIESEDMIIKSLSAAIRQNFGEVKVQYEIV